MFIIKSYTSCTYSVAGVQLKMVTVRGMYNYKSALDVANRVKGGVQRLQGRGLYTISSICEGAWEKGPIGSRNKI